MGVCSFLVSCSREAAKMLADENDARVKEAEEHRETSATSSQERLGDLKDSLGKALPDYSSSENCVEKASSDEPDADATHMSEGRPVSPGTLALMCDEQETVFAAASPDEINLGSNMSSQLRRGRSMTEAYAKQESIVLTKFRDCLNKLITLGEIKESRCSSMARASESDYRKGIINNASTVRSRCSSMARASESDYRKGIINNASTVTETQNQKEPYINGKSVVPSPSRTSQVVTSGNAGSDNSTRPKGPSPGEH
nr:protein tesmin/TSO1-like CXC 5 [Ipomoea batatas]